MKEIERGMNNMGNGLTRAGKPAKIATADNPMSDAKMRKLQKAIDRQLNPKTGKNGQMPPAYYEIEPNSTADILQKLKYRDRLHILHFLR